MKKCEILAPAGSMDSLKFMLKEGVDAIYIGLKDCSSRPGYADFSFEQIPEAVELCHAQNTKLYVALNAYIGEGQLDDLVQKIFAMDHMKVDAFIIAEYGLIKFLAGKLTYAKLHASTLMGVYNSQTVRMLKDMGVTRIIFYANLFIDEMAKIISAVPDMEYELVAEGGTCFNDIRQCHIPHGLNPGEHILYCRKEFDLVDSVGNMIGQASPISEPTVVSSDILGIFEAIGITSFKIEGRTAPAEERVEIVRSLKENINRFDNKDTSAYLHFLTRANRSNV